MWKNKYEALAKLYSQLRKEHIDLLNKYKALQVKANSAQEATEKLERIQADMRAKNIELADLIRERDRARNELARLQGNQREDMDRLRRELDDARDQMQNMGRSKGDEVSALLARFNKEKQDLEASLIEKQALIDEFLKQIEDQQGEADHIRQVNNLWTIESVLIGNSSYIFNRRRMKKLLCYKQVWMNAFHNSLSCNR